MDDLLQKVTAIIKTFERPEKVINLHRSLRAFYPHMKIVIVDDSNLPINEGWDNNTKYIHTSYDIGLSAGRNLAVSQVETPYILLLDDDFIFTRKTKIENFVKILENTDFQIVAGNVLDFGKKNIVFKGIMSVENDTLVLDSYKKGKKIGNFTCYDYVLNFFLVRTQTVMNYPWDNDLKIREHEEFFWRLKQNNVPITHTSSVSIAHFPTSDIVLDDDIYYTKRIERLNFYHNLACQKIGVTNFLPLGARYYGFGIKHFLIYLYVQSNKHKDKYIWCAAFSKIFAWKRRLNQLIKHSNAH